MSAELYAKTIDILKQYNIRAKKGLSQNFLIDEAILEKIIASARIKKSDSILEVGGGLGVLTEALADQCGTVLSLEIDQKLCLVLRERLREYANVTILCENILKFNPELYAKHLPFKAIGNLPYHLSGPILRWFLDNRNFFSEFCFMLQKEVAERIVSAPGSKIYGVLTLLCQYFASPTLLFTVPKESFIPKPQVESAFVKLVPKQGTMTGNSYFVPLVKQSFQQRRKTLLNNLKSWKILTQAQWETLLADLRVDGKLRAEALSLETYVQLAKALQSRAAAASPQNMLLSPDPEGGSSTL